MQRKISDDLVQLVEGYQNECTEWFSGTGPISAGYPFTVKGVFHSNDRFRFAMDHPYRSGFFKRILQHYGFWKDHPHMKSCFAVDLAHDLTKVFFGGAAVTAGFIWVDRILRPQYAIPFWADRILRPVRFLRLYTPFVCAGSLYYGVYNYLTGVLEWPVTKAEDMHYGASWAASFVLALSYSLISRVRQEIRPSDRFDSRFAKFIRTLVPLWTYFFLYNFIIANGYEGSRSHPRTNENSYVWQLTNPPGYNIVRQMPHLPYYKESPAFPHNDEHQLFAQPWREFYVRNPYFDPEYTAKAKAQAQRVLANYRI